MIKLSLSCDKGHGFEGWFRSSGDYDAQRKRRLVECPVCASKRIDKALMAPALHGVDRPAAPPQAPLPVAMPAGEDTEMRAAMRKFRDHVLATSEDVGERFAEEARKIHYEEVEKRSIRGRATPDEAQALREEGVEFGPLPVLPDDHN